MLTAVFTASLTSLFYEILLSYYFAEAQWNNLYFFVISISLFGYSAGGLIINLVYGVKRIKRKIPSPQLVSLCLFVLSVGIPGSYLAVNFLGIDYFRIPFEPTLAILLVLQYCILAVPFIAAGTIIAAAFAAAETKTHRVYTATMTGSTVGVAAAFLVIPSAGVETGILLCGLLPVLPRCFIGSSRPMGRRAACLFACAFIALLLLAPSAFRPIPSTYKPLSSLRASRGTRIIESRHSLHGRVDVVESPLLRASPGLSLGFQGTIPASRAVVLNGGRVLMLYDFSRDLSFASFSLPAAVHTLDRRYHSALVIEKGDGTAIPQAAAAGYKQVDVLEPVKELAEILRQEMGYPGLRILNAGIRGHTANAPGIYDLVYIDDTGSTLPGLKSLDEQFHLTVEAFTRYIEALSPGGILVCTRNLVLPPTDSVRIFRTLLEAMDTTAASNPAEHLVMLRNWNTYTILASRQAFTAEELASLRGFAEDRGFDPVYYPDISEVEVNRFNIFDEPYHHKAIMKTLDEPDTLFNTAPRTDTRPYVYSFVRLRHLKEAVEAVGGRPHIVLSSGDILVWILLAAALVVAAGFLVLPVLILPKVRTSVQPAAAGYFSLLGLAFMFVETGFIKLLALPTGDSLVSFSLVLSVILIISGVGSYLGRQIEPAGLRKLMYLLCLGLFTVAVAGFPVVKQLMGLNEVFLYAGLVILTALPAVAMGIPFPAGMRFFAPSPPERAYAWAANGVFSVLSAILSVPVALYAGIPALFGAAGIAYLAAGSLIRPLSSRR